MSYAFQANAFQANAFQQGTVVSTKNLQLPVDYFLMGDPMNLLDAERDRPAFTVITTNKGHR